MTLKSLSFCFIYHPSQKKYKTTFYLVYFKIKFISLTEGMTGFPATTRKHSFAVGSGCWRFATIAQTVLNRSKSL